MFMFMTGLRLALGVSRALIGLGAWLAPDLTVKFFGIDPSQSDRFVGRLFGARELALAGVLLAAPSSSVARVATIGAAVDALDSISGLDERRRGNLSTRATLLGPIGALLFVTMGLLVARESRGDA